MNLANKAVLDLVSVSPATIFNKPDLSTTPVQYPDCSSFSPQTGIRRFCITNKSQTAYVAVGICATTTSPTFAAGAAGTVAATEGFPVLPLSQLYINLKSDLSLWVVASAASTPVQVLAFDQAGK
jgi:hypothetical protein